jgi:hypothetical protein
VQTVRGVRERRYWLLNGIAGEIHPFDEMRHLVAADADQDFQYFCARRVLCKGRIEAGTMLGRRLFHCLHKGRMFFFEKKNQKTLVH